MKKYFTTHSTRERRLLCKKQNNASNIEKKTSEGVDQKEVKAKNEKEEKLTNVIKSLNKEGLSQKAQQALDLSRDLAADNVKDLHNALDSRVHDVGQLEYNELRKTLDANAALAKLNRLFESTGASFTLDEEHENRVVLQFKEKVSEKPGTKNDSKKESGAFDANPESAENLDERIRILNESKDALFNNLDAFVTKTPLGKIFKSMKYEKGQGDNILIRINGEHFDSMLSIAKANGRGIDTDNANYVTISGGPGGGAWQMAKGGADIMMPCFKAWGGEANDSKNQMESALNGMKTWAELASAKVPDDVDTTSIDNAKKEEVLEKQSANSTKIQEVIDRLKTGVDPDARDISVVRFLTGITAYAGQKEGSVALVSSNNISDLASKNEFAYFRNKLAVLGGNVTLTQNGDYAINIPEESVQDVADEFNRMEAFFVAGGAKKAAERESGEGAFVIGRNKERPEQGVTESEEELPPAKDARVGQIRRDNEGNYWKKAEDGMWESFTDSAMKDPDTGKPMTSQSGYRNVHWGDSLIEERGVAIVDISIESEEVVEKEEVDNTEERGDLSRLQKTSPEDVKYIRTSKALAQLADVFGVGALDNYPDKSSKDLVALQTDNLIAKLKNNIDDTSASCYLGRDGNLYEHEDWAIDHEIVPDFEGLLREKPETVLSVLVGINENDWGNEKVKKLLKDARAARVENLMMDAENDSSESQSS